LTQQLLNRATILFKEKKFDQVVEWFSATSPEYLLSSPPGVLILNYKARCLYQISKQHKFSDMSTLEEAFNIWQTLYNKHFTPELTDSFDELWDTAERLDAGQQGGNVDRLCSQIRKVRYIINIYF
jgi:hypothetical protein